MCTILADPSAIAWDANTSKREADRFLYRSMAYDLSRMSPVNIRVLSLPGPTWSWEVGLAETFARNCKFNFTGIERDEVTHAQLVRMADALEGEYNVVNSPIDFQSFAESYTGVPFDVIYLDWMGTWSKEKKDNISALLRSKMLAKGGLLILTVSLSRGGRPTNDELHDLSHELPLAFYDARGSDKHVSSVKVRGIPQWIAKEAENFHATMRPIMGSVYYSLGVSNQTSPQLHIMLLREND